MILCVVVGASAIRLAVGAFTLGWTHSIEHTRWEEDWRITPQGLEIVEARVRGSGAGMDPGEGAVLRDGWWRWTPVLAPLPDLVLAASGATSGGWDLCTQHVCHKLGANRAEAVRLAPC